MVELKKAKKTKKSKVAEPKVLTLNELNIASREGAAARAKKAK